MSAPAAGRNALLKLALPLVRTHGFTRHTLALSALSLPSGSHRQPLNDTAVSALFGEGDDARRTLINAWLDDARSGIAAGLGPDRSMHNVLDTRLKANEPVLQFLPEVRFCSWKAETVFMALLQAFAILSTPSSPSRYLPPILFDPRPAISHTTSIADEACYILGDTSVGVSLNQQIVSYGY